MTPRWVECPRTHIHARKRFNWNWRVSPSRTRCLEIRRLPSLWIAASLRSWSGKVFLRSCNEKEASRVKRGSTEQRVGRGDKLGAREELRDKQRITEHNAVEAGLKPAREHPGESAR